jgi:DNA-binding transcriptional ArsR family regulator
MSTRYALADLAALMAEPTRAAMLLSLMGGEALPAGELARAAGLSAAATSLHLGKLLRGGLLSVRREGRHRYYRLAGPDVAHAVEGLGRLAQVRPQPRALSKEQRALRAARSCYDHLAGQLAVALVDRLEHARLVLPVDDYAFELSDEGRRWFARTLDIETHDLAHGRRPLARRCLDWTERRPHLAGALGAAVLTRLLERRWLARIGGSRALRLTSSGERELRGLGLALAAVGA